MTGRNIAFHKEIRRILNERTERGFFRIDDNTVGITEGPLCKAILNARPMYDFERIVFKPIMNTPVGKAEFSAVMKAVAHDVRCLAENGPAPGTAIAGTWPNAGYRYLQASLFAGDPWPMWLLTHRIINRAGSLKPVIDACAARMAGRWRGAGPSSLANIVLEAGGPRARRFAITLYRRTARSVCATVASLVTNVLLLASREEVMRNTRHCITESLRLMPPAWMYHRAASAEFTQIDARIRETDDVLVIPLITQRDPAIWPQAENFVPDRWEGVANPEDSEHYFPFGHSHDRCWARELVLALSEATLKHIAAAGYWADPAQRQVNVALRSLLSPTRLKVVAC